MNVTIKKQITFIFTVVLYSLPSSEPVSSVAEINSSTATSKYPAKILSFAIFGLLLPDFQSEKVDFGIPVSFATL